MHGDRRGPAVISTCFSREIAPQDDGDWYQRMFLRSSARSQPTFGLSQIHVAGLPAQTQASCADDGTARDHALRTRIKKC